MIMVIDNLVINYGTGILKQNILMYLLMSVGAFYGKEKPEEPNTTKSSLSAAC